MKLKEREKAIKLRKQGLTYTEIMQQLQVSKGSLSLWLRNIPYTPTEQTRDRRRLASFHNGQILHNRKLRRTILIMKKAKDEISTINPNELKLLGTMAYWTEGSKTKDNLVQLTNSDPKIIQFALEWLRESCGVQEEKLRIHIHAHSDVNVKEAEYYWSRITQVPLSQFHKTTAKKSGSDGRCSNKLQYGIATVTICDTDLHYKIQGWIKGLIANIKS